GHNRRVGGVPNSYHLLGRAIDIARRPGVSHWQIAAAYRNAGYHLVESLDEGDHSHFAFGSRGEVRMARATRPQATASGGGGSSETNWGIAYAPGARR
ncbi:MAG TPA: D-Ala-D-Ala carboxypeptidase family metallohydrolase, partial [Sphingomicrobium sp.]|nr:D-Ala-D-Ala carboxypeptidase family metallohydrolase [Sphingomicrobium sp.]